MDEETKQRIEELEKKISDITTNENTRFDYVKWYIGGITIVLSILALVFGFNYNADKTSFNETINRGLGDLKKSEDANREYIKEKLGTIEDIKIELLGITGIDLIGQDLPLTFRYVKGECVMNFRYIVESVSDAPSGLLSYKLYTTEPLVPTDTAQSADEPKYKYEHVYNPEDLKPNSLLGRMTFSAYMDFAIKSDILLHTSEKYPGLLKLYYGKGKVAVASVSFVVNKDGPPCPTETRG
jgi:hypothetical protein